MNLSLFFHFTRIITVLYDNYSKNNKISCQFYYFLSNCLVILYYGNTVKLRGNYWPKNYKNGQKWSVIIDQWSLITLDKNDKNWMKILKLLKNDIIAIKIRKLPKNYKNFLKMGNCPKEINFFTSMVYDY